MIEQILSRIEKLDAGATRGPWRLDDPSWKEFNDITVWCGPDDPEEARCLCNMGEPIECCSDKESAEISYANGEFIAASRHLLPLCAKLIRIFDEFAVLHDCSVGRRLRDELQAALAATERGEWWRLKTLSLLTHRDSIRRPDGKSVRSTSRNAAG